MQLESLVKFKGRKGPLLLVVADGVGLAEAGPANALSIANTPNIDALLASSISTQLHAHGTHVGLPTDDDMGNSEVGHNTLGGGRIFDQGAKLVNAAFASESIFESESWRKAEQQGKSGNTLHFLGILSDGNVHSHCEHLFLLMRRCQQIGIKSVVVHALLDGRDVDPRSALIYLAQLNTELEHINSAGDFNYRLGSGGGRMSITMDRYEADWDMVERGFNTHVHGDVSGIGNEITDVMNEVQRQYDTDDNINDQYLAPFVLVDDNGPVGKMRDGDAVILFNFRGDRAIEISQALEDENFSKFDRGDFPDIFFCGMLQYDGDLNVPHSYLVNPPTIQRTMCEYMCGEGLRTFAISETQKFGHVTFFWNGNRSGYLDKSLETYIEVPSDNCQFNEKPQMKAVEITDETIKLLETGEYRFGRINFANGDMVGHTGDIAATAKSLECVDHCLGRLIQCIEAQQGILIFTADHGNADEMFVEKNGQRIPRTSHSLNPVPLAIVDNANDDDYVINTEIDGGLANVAATVFNLMGYRAPEGYHASLIDIAKEPSRRNIYKGRIVNFGLESIKLPNNEMMVLEVVRHPGGVVLIAQDDEQKICLIKQFRHAADGWIWELPAGVLDVHELPKTAALRELKEETGCTAEHIQPLGSMVTSPGFCDERLHFFLATELSKGETAHEAHEFIELHWLPLNHIELMIESGEIDDAKSIVGIYKTRNRLGQVG